MLKALGWLIKISIFAVAVLLAGDWFHWGGRTLTQHLESEVSHAGRSETAAYLRGLTRRLTEDARAGWDAKSKQRERNPGSTHATNEAASGGSRPAPGGARRNGEAQDVTDRVETQAAAPATDAPAAARGGSASAAGSAARTVARAEEQIAPSERQKLRALIRELNSSHD